MIRSVRHAGVRCRDVASALENPARFWRRLTMLIRRLDFDDDAEVHTAASFSLATLLESVPEFRANPLLLPNATAAASNSNTCSCGDGGCDAADDGGPSCGGGGVDDGDNVASIRPGGAGEIWASEEAVVVGVCRCR